VPERFRTWCEIDLSAIAFNLQQIRKRVGKNRLIAAVVKADAYGHGIHEVSRFISMVPNLLFAVATLDEAFALRQTITKNNILTLSCLRPYEIDAVIQSKCIPNVSQYDVAKKLDAVAKKCKHNIKIHIEVDTGIGRIGPYYTEAVNFIKKISGLQHIYIEGIFTHFASADKQSHFTKLQIQRFNRVLDNLHQMNIYIPIKHAANSAGIIRYPDSFYNMVRPGLMLYGQYPANSMKLQIQLKQAMSLKSEIIYLKKVPAGFSVSYGRTYITKKPAVIATVSIGYRNGYSRLCSNQARALLKGKRVPVIGRVCMDQLMLDVSTVTDVKVGDQVVFLGQQDNEFISMDEIAKWSSSINYETSCTLGIMNKRIYLG